jgi:hypothetical protein
VYLWPSERDNVVGAAAEKIDEKARCDLGGIEPEKWLLNRTFAPAHPRSRTKPRKTPGQGTMKHVVELLIAYSHSAQAADLLHCHSMALASPVLKGLPG